MSKETQTVVHVVCYRAIDHCEILAVCTTPEKALEVVKEQIAGYYRKERVFGKPDRVYNQNKTQEWKLCNHEYGDWIQVEERELV